MRSDPSGFSSFRIHTNAREREKRFRVAAASASADFAESRSWDSKGGAFAFFCFLIPLDCLRLHCFPLFIHIRFLFNGKVGCLIIQSHLRKLMNR